MIPLIRRRSILFFGFASMLPLSIAIAEPNNDTILIDLQSHVTVIDEYATLGDIATLSESLKDSESIRNIKVAVSPIPGKSRHLDKAEIERVIRGAVDENVTTFTINGPQSIRLTRASQRLEHDLLRATAEEYLKSHIDRRYRDTQVELANKIRPIDIPLGTYRLKPSIRTNEMRSRMCVWLDIIVDNTTYQTVPLWFSVRSKDVVFVASRDLQTGQKLSSKHLGQALRDIGHIGSHNIPHLQNLSGYRLTRPLKMGEILTSHHIESVPAVVKGESVDIISVVGNINLQAKAIAVEDGQKGEQVLVRNTLSGLPFEVTVVDIGLAIVTGSRGI